MGQPIVAHRAVIALDIGVLLRLAGLDEVNADAALGGPGHPISFIHITEEAMLKLNEQERAQLSEDGSLTVDGIGNETLIGLSASESGFVLRYQKEFNDRQSLTEQHVYLRLRQRHATAHTAAVARLTSMVEQLRKSAQSNKSDYCEREANLTDLETSLDVALADSFPASDPIAISITAKERNLWALIGNDFQWLGTRR